MVKYVYKVYKTLLMLCCLLLPVAISAQVAGDSARVTIAGKNIPLTSVFKSIASQTGYYFVFDNAIIDNKAVVSVNFKAASWEAVLAYVLKNRNVTWFQQGKRIFLQMMEMRPPVSTVGTDSVSMIIRGRITDVDSRPIPGVTIVVKGTPKGVTTGNDGEFMLSNINNNALLHISSLGFVPKDTILQHRHLHEIKLEEAINTLDATVVIGYGSSSRRMLTGAVSRIQKEQIAAQPVANSLAAIQGQVPGVLVTTTNGLPGAQIKVYIRGRNSIAAGNDPLFIVDGVPFDITPLNNTERLFGAAGRISPFNSINSADIESIDILKDADATAIYGSRGANGVVLITTKKGKAGKTKVDINVNSGMSVTAGKMSMLNTRDYLAIRREAFANDGVVPTVADAPDLLLWDTTLYVNWFRKMTGGTAPVTNAQVGISGGNNYTTFLASGNFYSEGTILPAALGYRRGGGHISIQHHHPDEKLDIALTASFTGDRNKGIANDVSSFYNLPPNFPLYDGTGKLFWGTAYDNPAAYLQQQSNNNTNNLVSNAVLRYQLLPGLQLKTSLGLADIWMRQLFTFPQSTQHPHDAPTSFTRVADNSRQSYIIEPQADYTLRIAKGSLHTLVGGTWQQTVKRGSFMTGQGYRDETLLGNLAAADTIIRRPDTYSLYRYISFFTRITYDWQRKYLVNVSYRRDGSSRFGPGRQFGDFGSVGLAWIFTEEPFMKRLPWLSYGKLRASGGITGNDQIEDYKYMSNYGPGENYQGNNTVRPLRIANSNYSWEENRKMEGAMDLGFLQERIFFSVAKYWNRSNNQLVGYQLPGITGFTSYQTNLPAQVVNTGWEFELRTTNVYKADFSWTTAANISFSRNRLTSFRDLAASSYANAYLIGQSLNIARGYHFTGVDSKTGLAQFEDINGDGVLSNISDFTTIANLDPKYYGGIQNDLKYRDISLGFFWQFVKQEGYTVVNKPGDFSNQSTESLQRWRKPGDRTAIPRAATTPGNAAYDLNANLALSNAAYADASYLRLRNVVLAYNLSPAVLKKLRLQLCRIYLQGQNLFTITGYKGADPETQFAMPPLKVLTSGIQLTL